MGELGVKKALSVFARKPVGKPLGVVCYSVPDADCFPVVGPGISDRVFGLLLVAKCWDACQMERLNLWWNFSFLLWYRIGVFGIKCRVRV